MQQESLVPLFYPETGKHWVILTYIHSISTGKSSLTVQFVENHFVESYYPTIENTFSRIIKYKGQEYATEIIDTAGQVGWFPRQTSFTQTVTDWPQDEYSILNSRHSIGIHGYMLVYSVASKQSFEMIKIIRGKILNHLVRASLNLAFSLLRLTRI